MLIAQNRKDQYYFKQKLVPFGEYYPLGFITKPLLKSLDIPYSNLTPGSDSQPAMRFDKMAIQPLICYDAAYSSLVKNIVKNKGVIAIISDDSWFGDSSALDQQLQIAQMRALETGRYALVANNTGITAIISNKGLVIKTTPTHKRAYVQGTFRKAVGSTPYMVWGYYAVWLLILALVCSCLFFTNKQKSIAQKDRKITQKNSDLL